MPRAIVCLVLLTLLSGCSTGLVLNLYNATGDTLTVTNPPFRKAVTIPPNTSADVSIGTDVLVRSSRHAWQYSQRLLIPPQDFFQKRTMLYRLFGKIDRHGEIYLFAPPPDHGTPQPTTQPRGFPVKPQRDLTNRWSQPLAVAMCTFNFTIQFREFAALVAASGGSARSR